MDFSKEAISKRLRESVIKRWNETSDAPLTAEDFKNVFIEEVSSKEKKENKHAVQKIAVLAKLGHRGIDEFAKNDKVFHIGDYMGMDAFDEFYHEMCVFFDNCFKFDENITMPMIWQAIRNYFIYACVVGMEGNPQKATQYSLGFSLLYPYTDNFIDDANRDENEKNSYDQFIKDVIRGENVTPKTKLEEQTGTLLHWALPENKLEVSRQLLQLMLDAQHLSEDFIGKEHSFDDVLFMLSYKGALSVLCDYMYSVDKMTEEGVIFNMKFGYLLQVADDIQDIKEDQNSKMSTLLSIAKTPEERGRCVCRLIRYTFDSFNEYQATNDRFKKFLMRNCVILILDAVIRSRPYFSDSFINELERYLPFSAKYFEKFDQHMRYSEMPIKSQEKYLNIVKALTKEELKSK